MAFLLLLLAALASAQSNCVLMGNVTQKDVMFPQGIAAGPALLALSDSGLDGVVFFSLLPTSAPYQLPAPLDDPPLLSSNASFGLQGGIAAAGDSFVVSAFDEDTAFSDELRRYNSSQHLEARINIGRRGTMYGVGASATGQLFVANAQNHTAMRFNAADQLDFVLPFSFSNRGPVGSVVYENTWYLTDRQPPLVYEFDLLDLSAPPIVYTHLPEVWYFSRCGDLAFFSVIGGSRVEVRNATNNMTLLQTMGEGIRSASATCRKRPDARVELYWSSNALDRVFCALCTPPTPAPTPAPTLPAVVDEPTIVVGDATITGVSTISSQLNVTGVLTLNNTALQSEGGVITAGSVVITGGTLTVTTSKGEAGAPIEVIDAAQVSGDFALLDVMVSDLLECETATVEREPTQTGYSVLVTVDSSGCDALPLGALIGIIVGCVALVVLAIAIPLAIAAHRRKRDLEVQLQHMASKPM